ncbi:hypothetical protein C2E23DRAFT_495190 [Lenzites betulinus]|nr:hypothetical protein C2E23DRAFT_495190 [Lenzites betulinus]
MYTRVAHTTFLNVLCAGDGLRYEGQSFLHPENCPLYSSRLVKCEETACSSCFRIPDSRIRHLHAVSIFKSPLPKARPKPHYCCFHARCRGRLLRFFSRHLALLRSLHPSASNASISLISRQTAPFLVFQTLRICAHRMISIPSSFEMFRPPPPRTPPPANMLQRLVIDGFQSEKKWCYACREGSGSAQRYAWTLIISLHMHICLASPYPPTLRASLVRGRSLPSASLHLQQSKT